MDDENKQLVDQARQDHKARERVGESLSAVLNRIADDIDQIDRQERLTLFRQQIKAHQYMDGNFYGYVDQNFEWQQKQKGADEVWYSDNQLYPYLRTALMELSRTQTEVVITAPEGAPEDTAAAAKFAQARYNSNRERTFNARLKQTENAYALLNGITYRYTYPEFEGGRKERVPKVRQNAPGEDGEAETIIGYEEVATCQNAWTVPNPIGIIVSLRASCIRETPFLKWKQGILRAVLQERYKGIELPAKGELSIELRYTSGQQTAAPAAGAGSSENAGEGKLAGTDARELEELEFEQVWLDYPLYCNIKFEEDMPLGRGKVLKAGQPLGSVYPKGLYYARVDKLVLDLWNEDKNRKWTSSPYGLRPGSMYGTGSAVALSDQEIINDIETIKMANAWANGVPRDFVDPDYISELSSDPQIPTRLIKGMNGQDIIGSAYAQAPATPLGAEIYQLADSKASAIQNKIGAMSGAGAGGLQDAQKWGDTATAISIKRDLAVGRFSPDLELMADMLDREQAFQFLENEQQLYTPAQWEREKGEYGEDALKAFLACDIRRDLRITIAPGSHMPKSDAQVQAKLISYAQIIPILAQMQSPELIAYAAELFGVPEHLAGWNSERTHVDRLIKRFEALAQLYIEQFGDLPDTSLEPVVTAGVDPTTGEPVEQSTPSPAMEVAQRINDYSKIPVDVFLDNHDAIIDALRDWRATDMGRSAPNALVAAVALRTLLHHEGAAKQEALLNRRAIAAAQPMKDDAKADQAEAMAVQQEANAAAQEQAAEQTEAQMLAQGADKIMEYADRDEAREHEKEMKTADQIQAQAFKDQEAVRQAAQSAVTPTDQG